MLEIGIILIIFLAVASGANRKAQRQQQENQGDKNQGRARSAGPLQQAMRQLQESMERTVGAPQTPAIAPETKAPKARESLAASDFDPGFWGSMQATEDSFHDRVFQGAPQAEGELSRAVHKGQKPLPKAEDGADHETLGVIPRMTPSSLVQAVVTHEILTRPRSAWRPRREAVRARAPGA